MIKKILFGTDLSAFTSHTLIHVETLANQFDAKICVVHAVPPLGELAAAVVKSHCSDLVKSEVLATHNIRGLFEALRDEIYEVMAANKYVNSNITSRISDVIVSPGHPAAVILYEAERLGVDLIVLGSHSTEALDGCLLGSVTAKVMQLAKVPVYMVPMMNPANMVGIDITSLPHRNVG